MERKTVESTLLRSVGFDAASQTLEVEFLPGKKAQKEWELAGNEGLAPGPIFQYLAVPQERHVAMMGENQYGSPGKYFYHVIKPNYQAKEIPREKENEQVSAQAKAHDDEAPRETVAKPNS
jgi:hypothetical protein